VETIAVFLSLANVILLMYVIKRFVGKNFYQKVIENTAGELRQLILEMNQATERNVQIVEDRLRTLKSESESLLNQLEKKSHDRKECQPTRSLLSNPLEDLPENIPGSVNKALNSQASFKKYASTVPSSYRNLEDLKQSLEDRLKDISEDKETQVSDGEKSYENHQKSEVLNEHEIIPPDDEHIVPEENTIKDALFKKQEQESSTEKHMQDVPQVVIKIKKPVPSVQ